MLWPLVSPRKLNLKILCFSECKVSAQYIFSQNFLAACESFLFIPQRLSDWRKNYPTMNQSVQVESKIWGNFVYPSFRKILIWLTRWSCELFCFFFVAFTLFKSYEKSAAMHKSYINFLSNMRQKLLLVFQHQTLKILKNIQNIHWTCLNVQLNYGLRIYFLFLHVKIKTAQKISQFSCFHYTSAHAIVKPIRRFYITFKSVVL